MESCLLCFQQFLTHLNLLRNDPMQWKALSRHTKVRMSVFNYAVSESPRTPRKPPCEAFMFTAFRQTLDKTQKAATPGQRCVPKASESVAVSENTAALCRPAVRDSRSERNLLLPPAANLGTANPERSCLGPGSLVCVPVHTCTLWSFICRSPSIAAMFPEPGHLQQLKMPLQLAGSAGL